MNEKDYIIISIEAGKSFDKIVKKKKAVILISRTQNT